MTTLLHIDSSILGEASVSRVLSAAVVDRLSSADATMTVSCRDLVADALPHLAGHHIAPVGADAGLPGWVTGERLAGEAVMAEFLAAEIVVIGVGFYNFGIASQLKAWIDRILVAGRTFRYGPDGRPEGLMQGKRVILAIARGGYYGPGTPASAFEHAETHLRAVFGFIGVTRIDVVAAEGTAVGPGQRAEGIRGAMASIAALAAAPGMAA